ncbi:hypothetical protein Q1695_011337 [Nippostrongylus brasiliensis]|nr:hypothetical protein Q1695_011337 [Nippostrongylus brasiliensis]
MPSEFVDEKLPSEVLSKLASFRESGTFCDVILEADSSLKAKSEPTPPTSIRAHKLVLAAVCPYFRDTLSMGNFVESKEIRIVVKDIDDETLRLLVDYMYSSRLNIDEKNLRALFGAAKILHLDSDAVFEAVINWVKHDSSRRASLPNVLVGVRLPLISREFLLDRVYTEPMIRESSACMVMLGNIFHNMLSKNKTSDIPESWYRRRQTPHPKMIMIAGGERNGVSSLADVNIYDIYSQKWTPAASLHQPRRSFGMATVDDLIYAVGGASINDVLRSVEIYDAQRDWWRAGPKMQYCRYGVGVTALNGRIFAVGGNIGTQAGRKAEMLDPRQGKWISLPSMRSGRSHFGLAAVNGLLYAAGGDSKSPILNSVEVYDPRACRWTAAEPMLKKRWYAGVTVLRDQIVVVGGSDENDTVLSSAEMLTDKGWAFFPEMSLPKEGLGVVNVDGSLFAFGGYDGGDFLSCIEYLDFDSSQWKMSQACFPSLVVLFFVMGLRM